MSFEEFVDSFITHITFAPDGWGGSWDVRVDLGISVEVTNTLNVNDNHLLVRVFEREMAEALGSATVLRVDETKIVAMLLVLPLQQGLHNQQWRPTRVVDRSLDELNNAGIDKIHFLRCAKCIKTFGQSLAALLHHYSGERFLPGLLQRLCNFSYFFLLSTWGSEIKDLIAVAVSAFSKSGWAQSHSCFVNGPLFRVIVVCMHLRLFRCTKLSASSQNTSRGRRVDGVSVKSHCTV
mmetsp:Transcript_96351/g.166108  ORF Transcript_96351/g.166108 Transcript_96351/m.166108 type:complete len:236 (-) Transcript_96351:16-723(-)